MIVADTDVLIDFLENRGAARQVARLLEAGNLATTAISRFELLAGVRSARQGEAVLGLLVALPTLDLGTEAADAGAEIKRNLDSQGQSIGMADCLISGIVLTRGALLLTRNRRHFERVPDLRFA